MVAAGLYRAFSRDSRPDRPEQAKGRDSRTATSTGCRTWSEREWLVFAGDSLVINVSTSAGGRIRIGLFDTAGQPLRLEVELKDADLHAITFE